MTEREARAWIDNMRACVRADSSVPANVASHLNEIHRFLIAFCCPDQEAAAYEQLASSVRARRLTQLAKDEAVELGLDSAS